MKDVVAIITETNYLQTSYDIIESMEICLYLFKL